MTEFTEEDDALLAALGVDAEPTRSATYSPREERILAGFEDIQRFVDTHGRRPRHGEDRDIFERLYAVRLDRLRVLPEAVSLLAPFDRQQLLTASYADAPSDVDALDDDALLAELGVGADASSVDQLRHVRSVAEKRAAEEIANRTPCADFDAFKPLFERVQREIKTGVRQVRRFRTRALDEIQAGAFFVVGGQTAYVASIGEEFTTEYERRDSRLRVIYDNATESNVLRRSLQRALHRDDAARFITDPNAGPLFGEDATADDLASGTIYVLRSLSTDPELAKHRNVLHKIGVTGGSVETRIANAKLEPTFLMADVEVVATYRLFNVSRSRLENLVHRIFGAARLEVEIKDRFGHSVEPHEWFLVPLFIIDEAVERIRDGSITDYVYDPKAAKFVRKS